MTNEEYLKYIYCENRYDLSQEDDCNRLFEDTKNIVVEKPVFSFMMCVYNDISLLNAAINSLLKQAFTDWELLILDNSDKNLQAWTMIQNAANADKRIRCFKSKQNVGWAKGASILLPYCRGSYTTFLAADDCINIGALGVLNEIVINEMPDIIWVGNVGVSYSGPAKITLLGEKTPLQYMIFDKQSRSEAIIHIMKNVYYNSFFHYMKIDFLKKYRIDFFEPYYADNTGMTRAMTAAGKMVVLNERVYFLTMNTSQTAGKYIWDSYQFMFAKQWMLMKSVFMREHYNDSKAVQYVAAKILLNLFGNISSLCKGQCRDKYMNTLYRNPDEILQQLENILENAEIAEMLELIDFHGMKKFIENISDIDTIVTDNFCQESWIRDLIALSVNKEILTDEQVLTLLENFLLQEKNSVCLGFSYYTKILMRCDISKIQQRKHTVLLIIEKYNVHLLAVKQSSWLGAVYPTELLQEYEDVKQIIASMEGEV